MTDTRTATEHADDGDPAQDPGPGGPVLPPPPDPSGPSRLERTANHLWERAQAVPAADWVTSVVTFFVVAGCAAFVFFQFGDLGRMLSDTTPTGGDMSAHVWGPAFLRDHLLTKGRLTGWSNDWYAGFPAFQFYMVPPFLAIALLSLVIPYGTAFKLVAVSGCVLLPVACWAFGRLNRLPFPVPALLAVGGTIFLFDRSYAIYGGNIASTLAGEFAYGISLTLAILYLGVLGYGLRTGKARGWAALLLALAALCHVIPALFVMLATLVWLAIRPSRMALRYLLTIGPVALLLMLWWFLPFVFRSVYQNHMGWTKLTDYTTYLFTRQLTDSSVRNYPDLRVMLALGIAGLGLAIFMRQRPLIFLGASAAATAVAFRLIPDDSMLWNARVLPFYYLTIDMLALAGIGLAIILATRWVTRGENPSEGVVASVGGIALTLAMVLAVITRGAGFPLVPEALLEASRQLFDVLRIGWLMDAAPAVLAWGGIALLLLAALRWALADAAPGEHVLEAIAVAVVGLYAYVFLALPMQSLPGGELDASGTTYTAEYGLPIGPTLPLSTKDLSYVKSWAKWNFDGLESFEDKPRTDPATGEQVVGPEYGRAYPEFHDLITKLKSVAAERGCGRAMWEYEEAHDRFGSTMEPMMLPFFTDGCIGSMEGLYMESSATTPYHFINSTQLSRSGSAPQRELPYATMPPNQADFDQGVAHLQMLGVKYYLAIDDLMKQRAGDNTALERIADSGPWAIYEVAESQLVKGLPAEPAVYTGAGKGTEWLRMSACWYVNPDVWAVPLAAEGPDSWQRVHRTVEPAGQTAQERCSSPDGSPYGWLTTDAPEARPLEEVRVTNIQQGDDSISFDVDKPDVPVVVRTSYFPNWKVSGADGPFRLTPNLMVVIPNGTHVELHYGYTGIELFSYALTLVGIAALVLLFRAKPLPAPAPGPFYASVEDPASVLVPAAAAGAVEEYGPSGGVAPPDVEGEPAAESLDGPAPPPSGRSEAGPTDRDAESADPDPMDADSTDPAPVDGAPVDVAPADADPADADPAGADPADAPPGDGDPSGSVDPDAGSSHGGVD